MALSDGKAFLAGLGAGTTLGRLLSSDRIRFARMAGSSIASPSAAPWVTDFLNAAYYRRPPAQSDVDDLRLAQAILTSYWYRRGGLALRAQDMLAFHGHFGRRRFLQNEAAARGTLSREQLLSGADGLLGDWFSSAYEDDGRRGWGVVFPTKAERAAYEPELRLRSAQLGQLTPGVAPGEAQTWHTYPPVPIPSAEAALAALARPETWPDFASEIGRFTPLRRGGLLGQTFEIDVTAGTSGGHPVFQRGYVTVTRLVSAEDPEALRRYFEELQEGFHRFAPGEARVLPEGAEPVAGFDLTTHEGHFMGRGHNRLLLMRHGERDWVRAAGTWDPMPWHLQQLYRVAGRDAQRSFWGGYGEERQSMLHQVALRTGA